MKYNPDYLRTIPNITQGSLDKLKNLSNQTSLDEILKDKIKMNTFMLDFVYASAKLEGIGYDFMDSKVLLESGIPSNKHRIEEAHIILNIRDAYEYVLADFKEDISAYYIKGIHYLLTAREIMHASTRGTIRNSPVIIEGTPYEPPSGESQISAELNELLQFNESIEEPFAKAIHLHLNLCYLQPFVDVNKRTARTMQIYSMLNSGVMPLFLRHYTTADYLRAVAHYYETGDSTKYVEWFVEDYIDLCRKMGIVAENSSIGPSNIFGKKDY